MAVATGGRFAERSASVKPIGRERPERRARRRVVRVASTRDARLVELYSGIGATRLALEPLVTLKSAIAVDNSDAANAVYEANFCYAPRRVNVEHLDLNALFASGDGDEGRQGRRNDYVLTVSPPCQPYTRRGKGLASEDPRARSFHAVIDQLRAIEHVPRRIFVENVVGFESSDTRRALLNALGSRRYDVREFIVSPMALGIPYSRSRYYLIATLREGGFRAPTPAWLAGRELNDDGSVVTSDAQSSPSSSATLSEYIVADADGRVDLLLSPDTIKKYRRMLDVVHAKSRRCSTFTSGYGSTVFGGSVVLRGGNDELVSMLEVDLNETSGVARISERDIERFVGELRWFDVEEIKRLHGVRRDFTFDACSTKKAIFLLGNSISVDVVREVLRHLIQDG
jgi:tRNA (cytosine38-C5)-methyltransferase